MTHRLQRIQSQFQLSGRTRDRIWKKIVVNKIINQSKCLENNLHNENVKLLVNLAKDVSSGDKSNKKHRLQEFILKIYTVNNLNVDGTMILLTQG